MLQRNIELERNNERVSKELNALTKQQQELKEQLQQVVEKLTFELNEGQALKNIHEQQKKIINKYVVV